MPEPTTEPAALDGHSHAGLLDVLARAAPEGLKRFAETLIPALGAIEVLTSRTGPVMLPMRDTAQGTAFHLGEVPVAEAHVRGGGQNGHGMRRGRDLEAAMAMALADLAVARAWPIPRSPLLWRRKRPGSGPMTPLGCARSKPPVSTWRRSDAHDPDRAGR